MSAFLMHDAHTLTLARGGRWYGSYGMVSCPVCQPEGRVDQAALKICDGDTRLLLHCKKSGCAFRDILVALGIQPGTFAALDPVISARRAAERHAADEERAARARMIWEASLPIHGTVAEVYLRRRGITCALPDSLRFHRECWHHTGCTMPAMVARVDGAKRFGVHRTYLRPDGSGKAEIDQNRAMLGAVQGGAVRLTSSDGPLVVAEGIETAMSLASGLLDGPAIIWAALSSSGVQGLRLPDTPGRLIIASDGDQAGSQSAEALAERAKAAGWDVELQPAPEGQDWNDVLRVNRGA